MTSTEALALLTVAATPWTCWIRNRKWNMSDWRSTVKPLQGVRLTSRVTYRVRTMRLSLAHKVGSSSRLYAERASSLRTEGFWKCHKAPLQYSEDVHPLLPRQILAFLLDSCSLLAHTPLIWNDPFETNTHLLLLSFLTAA